VQEVDTKGGLVLLMDAQETKVCPSDVRNNRVVHTLLGIFQENGRKKIK